MTTMQEEFETGPFYIAFSSAGERIFPNEGYIDTLKEAEEALDRLKVEGWASAEIWNAAGER